MATIYKIGLFKMLVNTVKIAFWNTTSDTDWSAPLLSVQLPAVTVDYVIEKNISTVPGTTGSSEKNWAKFTPWRKLMDPKKILRKFRIKGTIKNAAWGTDGSTEATVMNKIIKIKDICEDGGIFTLTWNDNLYTVNCEKIIFTQDTKKWNAVDFVIDLLEGENN